MAIDKNILSNIETYFNNNYVPRKTRERSIFKEESIDEVESCISFYTSCEEKPNLELEDSWQSTLFKIIDQKELKDVDVYKRALITKQTFSKIRSNSAYQPDKDTAIKLCISLELSLDEALDFLAKAGYTLSKSIKRDVYIRGCILQNLNNVIDVDYVLNKHNLKPLGKYDG